MVYIVTVIHEATEIFPYCSYISGVYLTKQDALDSIAQDDLFEYFYNLAVVEGVESGSIILSNSLSDRTWFSPVYEDGKPPTHKQVEGPVWSHELSYIFSESQKSAWEKR